MLRISHLSTESSMHVFIFFKLSSAHVFKLPSFEKDEI